MKKEKIDRMAMISFWTGLVSLVSIPIYISIGYLFKEIEMMPSLSSIVFPLAIIGLVLGLIFRKKTEESNRSSKFAKAGIVMSAIALGLFILLFLYIMIVFLPELFRS